MNKENTEPGAGMSRCVGESRVHCLTENRKGNGSGRKVFPSSPSTPLVLSFLDPASFLSGEVMCSVLRPARETAKLGRTGWSGRAVDFEGVGGGGGLESSIK